MTSKQAEQRIAQAVQQAMDTALYRATIVTQQAQDASNTALLCVVWVDGRTTVTSVPVTF